MRVVGTLLLVVLAVAPGCAADVSPGPADTGSDGGSDGGTTCASDTTCDDHVYCNGLERCAPGSTGADAHGCVRGAPACTTGTCIETTRTCDTTSCATPDADNDGVRSIACGGTDCDDGDRHRFPGNPEICDPSHDEDCDPTTLGGTDVDADGFVDARCCNDAHCGNDCDDTRASTHPGAAETCNMIDDDCDAGIDESLTTATYARDCDGDGYAEIGGIVVTSCAAPPMMGLCLGWSTMATDCDDTDPTVNPANGEMCNHRDDNCNGIPDEGLATQTYARDCDGDGYGEMGGTTVTDCIVPPVVAPCASWSTQPTDCDDTDPTDSPSIAEVCDGHDNDCDGITDEGIGGTSLQLQCYPDADADGRAPFGSTALGVCTTACPGFTTPMVPVDAAHADCNDHDPAVADLVMGLADNDGDHVGGASVLGCLTGQANFLPGATSPIDCDDGNPDIFPGQMHFFPSPTGMGCIDATYHINCGNGTCGRLNTSCCPPITLPTCFTADVRPVVALWNWDCDPLPTGPPVADACTSCGSCRGGYLYSSTSQCGSTVTQNVCVSTCGFVGPNFCVLNSTPSTTLPCR